MIFVDTSAWYALSEVRDANLREANRALRSFQTPLITSDYVIDETLTLFRSRSQRRLATEFGKKVIDSSFAQIVTIEPNDFSRAWEVFQRFADKDWSFTDCTSRVVMERLGIERAFAFDEHFAQFGTVSVFP